VTGKEVKSEELTGKNNRISLNGIKDGVYFIKLGTLNKKIIITK
jgi:hypothetical protein